MYSHTLHILLTVHKHENPNQNPCQDLQVSILCVHHTLYCILSVQCKNVYPLKHCKKLRSTSGSWAWQYSNKLHCKLYHIILDQRIIVQDVILPFPAGDSDGCFLVGMLCIFSFLQIDDPPSKQSAVLRKWTFVSILYLLWSELKYLTSWLKGRTFIS